MDTPKRSILNDVEASDYLRMPTPRVNRLAKKGVIPHVLLPDGELRYYQAELADWVQAHHRPAEREASEQMTGRAVSPPDQARRWRDPKTEGPARC